MDGISLTIDLAEFDAALARLGPVFGTNEDVRRELMETLGAVGESQTRRRIEDEKTAPDGTPWKPNRAGTSILFETGANLRDSVAFEAGAESAEWGATWEYAHIHQEGAIIEPKTAKALVFETPDGKTIGVQRVTIPARPFVGLSAANESEIEEVVTDFFGTLLREGAR